MNAPRFSANPTVIKPPIRMARFLCIFSNAIFCRVCRTSMARNDSHTSASPGSISSEQRSVEFMAMAAKPRSAQLFPNRMISSDRFKVGNHGLVERMAR